jgi:hypothetical protein
MKGSLLILSLFLSCLVFANGLLQNIIPKQLQDILPTSSSNSAAGAPVLNFPNPFAAATNVQQQQQKQQQLEQELLQAIQNLDDRLANSDTINHLVQQLESTFSIPRPAVASQIYGRWRLLHTTNANTASPIQRKAVSSSQFPIYQDIIVVEREDGSNNNMPKLQLVVSQVVKFSNTIELKVDALASTSAYPLLELTERQGDGKILGWNILGVSLVGNEAQEDPDQPDRRIRFVFDEGNFQLPVVGKIPYPVPFRLPILRDAVKGWIDITYLSDNLRISRGNKGTTFILQKEDMKDK